MIVFINIFCNTFIKNWYSGEEEKIIEIKTSDMSGFPNSTNCFLIFLNDKDEQNALQDWKKVQSTAKTTGANCPDETHHSNLHILAQEFFITELA